MQKKLKARILSLALSVAMVTTMMPVNVFAAEGGTAPGVSPVGEIKSFDKLESKFIPNTGEGAASHIYGLTVEQGTTLEELDLPAELTAMVAKTTVSTSSDADKDVVDSGKVDKPAGDEIIPDEDETVDEDTDSDNTDETVSGNVASPSETGEESPKIEENKIPLSPEPEQDTSSTVEDTDKTVTTIESEKIPVTWNSDKEFTSDKNGGPFIYTVGLPEGYILSNGVEPLQIYVFVGNKMVRANTATYDVSTASVVIDDSCGAACQDHIITGTTTSNTIKVTGGTHNITLDNVSVDVNATGSGPDAGKCAFEIAGGADVSLSLKDDTTSTLKSGQYKAGLQTNNASLTIDGKGTLIAGGGTDSAGIGGSGSPSIVGNGGTITINSGIINAKCSGSNAPGIGGGNGGGADVIINGGTITAQGASYAPGIGGGGGIAENSAEQINVAITGGTVTAQTNNYASGIGIGAFSEGGAVTVTISGGTVITEGADKCYAIGNASNTTRPITIDITGNAAIWGIDSTDAYTIAGAVNADANALVEKADATKMLTKAKIIVPEGPSISIGTQPTATTTLTYGAISGSLTVAGTASNGNTVSYQWYKNTTNSATGGTLIPGATGTSYTIPTDLNAGAYYYYCVLKATDCADKASNVATVTVNKATATSAMTTVAASVSKDGKTGATAALPAKPAGATYGTLAAGGTITMTNMSISGDTLTYTAPASTEGQTGTITIPVTTATNYNDYTITVTITSTNKTPVTISGLSAPSKTYDGNAVANTAFGTPGYAPAWTGTLEYTYYEGSGTGVTKLSGAPKNAGTYTVVAAIPESDATHTGAHAAITFTISQATITIKANNKSAYVGDTVPALTSADCTITGLASGESLKTLPTVEYASTPDMSAAGTVAINAKDAVVPDGGNYNATITYQPGTLTITPKSSGGSSSSIWTSLPPAYQGGTKIIGNVRVPDYTVEGNWKKDENGAWNFTDTTGKSYTDSWAPLFNPYAQVPYGQRAFDWFKFDANGKMLTGWYTDTDGNTYYLNPGSDNTLGAMQTGWVLIDGKYYYFNEKPDGTRGKLLKNTTTPDGYYVDADGVCAKRK